LDYAVGYCRDLGRGSQYTRDLDVNFCYKQNMDA
jgi:hypothetical protein